MIVVYVPAGCAAPAESRYFTRPVELVTVPVLDMRETGVLEARNVAICIDQLLDKLVAVASYVPIVETILSSVILPITVERAVKPDPAAVSWFIAPQPKISSLAKFVVAGPLSTFVPLPVLDAVTSSGTT